MENRKIFIAVDPGGLKLLLRVMEALIKYELEMSSQTLHVSGWFSVLMPPSYMSSFDDEELPNGFFEWTSKRDIMQDEFLVCLRKIIENADTVSTMKSDSEFVCSSLHEIADELPIPGACILEVYVFGGKEYFAERDIPLLTSLKRFEVSHQAYFGLLSDQDSNELSIDWLNFIEFNCISVEDLLLHLKSHPVWAGSINVKLQKCYADISLQHYFLYSYDQSQSLSDICTLQNKHQKMTFDSKIEIVAIVTREALPLHLLNPHKFSMHTFPSMKHGSFNFFDVCNENRNVFFLGFLKYDVCNDSHKFSTSDWITYVSDPFTHYLSAAYCQQKLNSHCTLLIEFDKLTQTIFVYFFRMPDYINVSGFLKLLQSELADVSDDMLQVNGMEKMFYKNGADIIPPWEWCEKNSWHEEENLCKVFKSISRCKSDEFYMQGVMIPGIEALKDGIQHDSLGNILTLFDKTGHPVNSNLHPIPVIDDRLLKNIKCENSLKFMEYSLAMKVIGHGLDYCIDSLGSVHLADRLLKVQKRLVPEDTINFTSGKFNLNDESVIASKKKSVLKTKECAPIYHAKKIIKKKESRTEKHKRRLKTIVDGTVTKYGHISKKHRYYKECCDALFNVCIILMKKLKSSKDLNDHMKQFAKSNVNEVVISVLAMNDGN